MFVSVMVHDADGFTFNHDGANEQLQRRLSYSTETIIGLSAGGFFLLSLIAMNLYMNGWRKRCCKRSGICWSNIQNTTKTTRQSHGSQITAEVHTDIFSDNDLEMVEPKSESKDELLDKDQSAANKLGAILSNRHPQVLEAIKRMTDPCCGDVDK